MGNVLFHSRSSAEKFGGDPSDYLRIHKFLDQSKLYIADWRRRALMHHTLWIALCEPFFGDFYMRPSDGQLVSTRTVAEQHILEVLRAIPMPWGFSARDAGPPVDERADTQRKGQPTKPDN